VPYIFAGERKKNSMPKNLNLYGTNKRQIVRFNKDLFFKKHFSILEKQWDGADFWQHCNTFYPRFENYDNF
jgi:hypothetical protein